MFHTAWHRVTSSYRPATVSAHNRHFRTFIAFMIFMQLPIAINVHNVLIFLEYLYKNGLSPKVIKNYLSSISSVTSFYHLDHTPLSDPSISRFIRSITINSPFSPTPRGIFTIEMIYQISVACSILSDPPLYRAIFLISYFAFLRMSNIAPHSVNKFDPSKHFLRQDVILAHPGAHIVIKWTKTLQDNKSHHVVQIPQLPNIYLCPVRALKALLSSRPLPPSAPLFALHSYPHNQVIDTQVRSALKKILIYKNFPSRGFSFHAFRRSGATFAFDHSVPLQNIMSHGLWRSSAVWIYLQNASQAPSIIPSTFSANIPSHF